MLFNHKFRVKKNDHILEIEFERPSFSSDGRVLTCIVSQDYELSDNDTILLTIGNGDSIYVNIKAENFIEQGWAYINTNYTLLDREEITKEYTGDPENFNENDFVTLNWRYFLGDNGMIMSGYYVEDKQEDTDTEDNLIQLIFPELGVKSSEFDIEKTKTITLPIRYYVEDGFLNYRNAFTSKMLYDKNGNIDFAQKLPNGDLIVINDNEKELWKKKTRITIRVPEDIILTLENISLGKHEAFVTFDNKEYIIKEEYFVNGNTEGTEDVENIDDVYIRRYAEKDGVKKYEGFIDSNNNDVYVEGLTNTPGYEGRYPYTIKLWDDKIYKINDRIIPSKNGDILILSVDSDTIADISVYSNIIAERVTSINIPVYLEEDDIPSVQIDDRLYLVETVNMIDFSGEREIFFHKASKDGNDIYYVIMGNGRKVFFKQVSNDSFRLLLATDVEKTFPVIKKHRVIYNGKEYYKNVDYIDTESDEWVKFPFIIPLKPKLLLNILDKKAPNTYYCKLYNDDYEYNDPYRKNKKWWLYDDIMQNKGKYVFKIQPQLFFLDKSIDVNLDNIFDIDNTGIVDPMPRISLQKVLSELILPVSFFTLHGTNLQQEINVRGEFFEEKKKENINRIIDMEKDLYYPTILKVEDEKEHLEDATEIEFFLHLRTRDKNWEVRDDKLSEVESVMEDNYVSTITQSLRDEDNTVLEYNDNYYKTSWNIMDYYPEFCKQNRNGYYQPSDLLGFLDFKDDDVFYQKSKVGKTFLRMSFYSSKNPETQSLLGTSTVFFNSGEMFGKFVDTMTNPPKGITYSNPINWLGSSKLISCNREPINKTNQNFGIIEESKSPTGSEIILGPSILLDDEYRMSSTVTIANKLATDSSSEGFYNYIFREYSDGLHEREIYLRIQLNHAGHGEVIDLIQPMYGVTNDNGEITQHLMSMDQMLDGENAIKNGIPLKKLYDMMYIPIKVKYDYILKKYCWYLPPELVKHDENKIKFNLYEIKISKI